MPLRLSQNDPRWKTVIIPVRRGIKAITIGSDGCYLTMLCMGISKFYPSPQGNYVRPDDLTALLDFDDIGQVRYSEINQKIFKDKLGIAFDDRIWGYFPYRDNKIIKELCKNPDYFVGLRVVTKSGYNHWLYCVGRSFYKNLFGFACNDTWDGTRLWKAVGYLGKYVRIDGYVVFRRHKRLERGVL